MPKRASLPKSQLEIARIVWRLGTATVRQVLDALPRDRDLDFKTVQTYLRRLEAKGYLRTRLEGRSKVYIPRVREKTVVRQVIDEVMQRLFDGDAIPLLHHIVLDRGLTDGEIRQLRRMLDQLEGEEDDSGR